MRLSNRTFWGMATLVIVANALLMALVSGVTIQAGPRTISVVPAPGAGNISTRPTIHVRFRRPIEPDTLRDAVRLDPPASGTLEYDATGLTFQPSSPLQPNTEYRLIRRDGIREVGSLVASGEAVTTFRTRSSRLLVLQWASPGWELLALDPDTEQAHRIERGWERSGRDAPPPRVAVSPDGTRVALVTEAPGPTWTLWNVAVDGGDRRAILRDQPGSVSALAWSPRGDLIAYEERAEVGSVIGGSRIWIVGVDGAQTALVYGRAEERGSSPSWAPDGARLAFYETSIRAVVIFAFRGTFQSLRSEMAQSLRWSPDGVAAAVVDRAPGRRRQPTIRITTLEGMIGADTPWHEGDQVESLPAWSPAGDRLAYVRLDDQVGGVWIGSRDGVDARPVHQEVGWSYGQPVWSPDGATLAFTRQPLRAGALDTPPELWIADATPGGRTRKLAAGGWLVTWAP